MCVSALRRAPCTSGSFRCRGGRRFEPACSSAATSASSPAFVWIQSFSLEEPFVCLCGLRLALKKKSVEGGAGTCDLRDSAMGVGV